LKSPLLGISSIKNFRLFPPVSLFGVSLRKEHDSNRKTALWREQQIPKEEFRSWGGVHCFAHHHFTLKGGGGGGDYSAGGGKSLLRRRQYIGGQLRIRREEEEPHRGNFIFPSSVGGVLFRGKGKNFSRSLYYKKRRGGALERFRLGFPEVPHLRTSPQGALASAILLWLEL